MNMLFRTRRIFAALVAPMLLLLFFVATVPSAVQSSLAFVLFAYALAHICFWPPAFAAKFTARNLQLNSTLQLALLVGGFSLILCFVFATPFVFLHMVPDYGWGAVFRDAVSEAGAAVAAYILYCTILGGKSWNELEEPGSPLVSSKRTAIDDGSGVVTRRWPTVPSAGSKGRAPG